MTIFVLFAMQLLCSTVCISFAKRRYLTYNVGRSRNVTIMTQTHANFLRTILFSLHKER